MKMVRQPGVVVTTCQMTKLITWAGSGTDVPLAKFT
jgi:hypothetical protein